jgi:hypothetical protein
MQLIMNTEPFGYLHRLRRGTELLVRQAIYPYLKFHYHRFHIWKMKRRIERRGEESVVREHYFQNYGVLPNLEDPRTFQEKIAWIKIHMHDPLMAKCADKYAVRNYVKEKIGEEYLIPLLGVYRGPDEIPFAALEAPFVLKVTHASGGNVFCMDRNSFNMRKAKRILRHHLKINAYYYDCEWAYRDIPPRIVCEKVLLDEKNRRPTDYKFLCFNGEPLLIHVDIDRFGEHRRNFYDLQWNLLPVKLVKENSDRAVSRPDRLEEMVEIARTMSAPFDFVRVDLYHIRRRVYAGEMTFYPHGGCGPLSPPRYEIEYGEKLHLTTLSDAKVAHA